MADAVGTVRVDLFANLAEWQGGLNKATGQLNRFARQTDKIAKSFEKTGKAMSTALTLPLVAFGGFALKAASEAEDLQGVFNITFGEAAKDATEWAKVTGDAMGRSTQTIQKSAVAFGEFFEDFAPNEKAALELSKSFTVLTQDFAAFRNVSEDQAQSVLLKGLAGSARGLKSLGVDISDAALQAKAFQLGIAGANAELSEQQKVLARAAIIMAGTAKMQGEVARSLGETEEETKRAKENFQELLVTVGDQLLPIFSDLLTVFSQVISAYNGLDDAGKQAILVTAGLVAAAGPAAVIFGGIFKAVSLGSKALGAFSKVAAGAIGPTNQLGLSLKGALGWFIALAPAAYAAGEAIANAIIPNEDMKLQTLQFAEAQFRKLGLSAEEAAKARHLFAEAVDAGRQTDMKSIAAQAKLAVVQDANSRAFRKTIDAAIDEAVAMDEAAKAEADLKAQTDALIASFGDLTQPVATSADELERIRDLADPIGAAMREYNANLKLAKAAGVDAAQAQKVFGQAAVDAIRNVEGFRDSLGRLPPQLRAIVTEQDKLSDRTIAFGNALEKALEAREKTKGFGDALMKGLKDAQDEIARFGKSLTEEFDPAAKFKSEMAEIEKAWKAGAISAEVYAKAKRAAFEDTPEGQAQIEALKKRGEYVHDLAGAFTEAATGGENLGDAIRNIIVEGLKAEVIKPFFTDILNQIIPGRGQGPTGGAGGLGGGIDLGGIVRGVGSFLGFGGTRDKGGDVFPGMAYGIGSGVRETFIPDQPGKVVRGNFGAAGAGANIVQNFNGDDVGQYRASRRQMGRDARRAFAT